MCPRKAQQETHPQISMYHSKPKFNATFQVHEFIIMYNLGSVFLSLHLQNFFYTSKKF